MVPIPCHKQGCYPLDQVAGSVKPESLTPRKTCLQMLSWEETVIQQLWLCCSFWNKLCTPREVWGCFFSQWKRGSAVYNVLSTLRIYLQTRQVPEGLCPHRVLQAADFCLVEKLAQDLILGFFFLALVRLVKDLHIIHILNCNYWAVGEFRDKVVQYIVYIILVKLCQKYRCSHPFSEYQHFLKFGGRDEAAKACFLPSYQRCKVFWLH